MTCECGHSYDRHGAQSSWSEYFCLADRCFCKEYRGVEAVRLFNKQIPKTFYQDGDFECEFYELIEILEDLSQTDPFFQKIICYDDTIEDYLLKKEVIKKSTNGSIYGTSKLKQFYKEVSNLKVE